MSCGYQGYEFGAAYPDSVCVDGYLLDADNCDNDGNLYEATEDIPCPMCRPRDAIARYKEENLYLTQRTKRGGLKYRLSKRDAAKHARSLVRSIRLNRKRGTEPWKRSESAR